VAPEERDRAAGGATFRLRYEAFRHMLGMNGELLELMGDLEADLRFLPDSDPRVRGPVVRLLDSTLLLAETLNSLTGGHFAALYEAHARIEKALRDRLRRGSPAAVAALRNLFDVRLGDEPQVGGKAAHLGEVKSVLPSRVPDGFVITTEGFWHLFGRGETPHAVRGLIADLDVVTDHELFRQRAAAARELLVATAVPEAVREAIRAGVEPLRGAARHGWAVRSSAVGEDGALSFAGQFDTELGVAEDELVEAYRRVVASRFSDRALMYRLVAGLSEASTPMAVLFLPMVSARAAGVAYTRDPTRGKEDRMLVSATSGLADRLVTGREQGDSFVLRRDRPGELVEARHEEKDCSPGATAEPCLSSAELRALAALALEVESVFGAPQDIEWALDENGALWVLQARPLRMVTDTEERTPQPRSEVLMAGGMTVAPGRAVGPVHSLGPGGEGGAVPDGVILVAAQATPEQAAVLPHAVGFIAAQGNPAGHLAALLRELGIPSLFGMEDALDRLAPRRLVGLDATGRRIIAGDPWPGVRARGLELLQRRRQRPAPHPLYEHVLRLNLTDPMSSSFRASRCRSLHDIVRFCHEKTVSVLFEQSDARVSGERRPVALGTEIPLHLTVIDLGGAIDSARVSAGRIAPEHVASRPFAALWEGVTTRGVQWAGRTTVSLRGFASVAMGQQEATGPRSLGERNYLLVSPDYLNLNARLAYHYTTIDTWVEETAENNFVNFRFRGGGAAGERRDLRARFLEEVLLRSGFGVDRRGDLVTAWLRRYPPERCEEGLTMLGRLMGCARQLDMLLDGPAAVRRYVELFLAGVYAEFA
jgi:pyruvate,water dikinase